MKKSVKEMFKTAYKYANHYGQIGICDVDDLVQIAMLKLVGRDPMPATNGWLFKTMRSVVCDAATKKDIRHVQQSVSSDSYIVRESAFEDASDRMQHVAARREEVEIDLMPQMKNVLAKLSPPLRAVLVLYAEGYSYEEIAVLTNSRLGTVRSRLFYARKRAQEYLPDYAR